MRADDIDFEEEGDMTVEERTMLHSLLESIRLRRRRGAPMEEIREANDDLQGFINTIRKKGNR